MRKWQWDRRFSLAKETAAFALLTAIPLGKRAELASESWPKLPQHGIVTAVLKLGAHNC
jgi:hypothetical protein